MIGIDPQLISIDEWNSWKDLFDQFQVDLVPVETNLVDLIWSTERPDLPDNKIWIYPQECAGLNIDEKLDLLRRKLTDNQVEHLIVDRNDDIACETQTSIDRSVSLTFDFQGFSIFAEETLTSIQCSSRSRSFPWTQSGSLLDESATSSIVDS